MLFLKKLQKTKCKGFTFYKLNVLSFVHASNINSKDVHTFLRKGMEVKFQEATRADDPNRKCAVNVCNKEGEPISYFEKQGESDNFKRRDVTPGVKYKGTVKK